MTGDENLGDQVVNTLSRMGYDLSKVHDFNFYLYFKDQNAAQEVGTELSADNFQVEVNQSAADENWLCLVRKTLVPSVDQLNALGEKFGELASNSEGKFDGWERVPQPNEKQPPMIALQIGTMCYGQGQLDKAIEFLSDVAEGDSPFALDACRLLGNAHLKQEEREKAEKAYNKILAAGHSDPEIITSKGVTCFKQDRFDDALVLFQKAIEIAPDFACAHYNMACVYARTNDDVKSINALRTVLRLNRKHYGSLIKRDSDFDGLRGLPEYKKLFGKGFFARMLNR